MIRNNEIQFFLNHHMAFCHPSNPPSCVSPLFSNSQRALSQETSAQRPHYYGVNHPQQRHKTHTSQPPTVKSNDRGPRDIHPHVRNSSDGGCALISETLPFMSLCTLLHNEVAEGYFPDCIRDFLSSQTTTQPAVSGVLIRQLHFVCDFHIRPS